MTPIPKPSLSTPASSSNSSLVLPTPSTSTSTNSTRQQLEQQIAENEKLLQESNSGIGKNVLIRQISQLKERLKEMDHHQLQQQQQKPPLRRQVLASNTGMDDMTPATLDKLRSLERDVSSYRSPRLLSSHPIPSPSSSGLDSSSLLPLPPPPSGSTPTKRRSKVPNADRRNTDIEFATEIGQGLLLEVRKMQALLQEKDEQLNQLEIQKADLERAAEAMAKQLRQREEVEERLKEDTWNLELAKQELTISVTEMQQTLQKSNTEQNRLVKQMNDLRTEIEKLRASEEKLQSVVENMKQRHEQDMSSIRRHAAGLQREKLDQKKQIDALTSELAIAKAQTRIAKRSHSDMHALMKNKADSADAASSGDASGTDREAQSPKTSPPGSPKETPTRNQAMEVETLKTSLAHAHRMVSNLRSNMHREKTEKFELKKLLAESQETIEQLQNEPRMWEDARSTSDAKRSHKANGSSSTSKRRKGSTRRKRVGSRTPKGVAEDGHEEEEEEVVDSFDESNPFSDEDEMDRVVNDAAPATGFTSLSSELGAAKPKEMSLGDQLSMALSSSSSVPPRSSTVTVDVGTQTEMEISNRQIQTETPDTTATSVVETDPTTTTTTITIAPPDLQTVDMPSISATPVQQQTQQVQSEPMSVPVDAGVTADIIQQQPQAVAKATDTVSTQTNPVTMVPGSDSAVWTTSTTAVAGVAAGVATTAAAMAGVSPETEHHALATQDLEVGSAQTMPTPLVKEHTTDAVDNKDVSQVTTTSSSISTTDVPQHGSISSTTEAVDTDVAATIGLVNTSAANPSSSKQEFQSRESIESRNSVSHQVSPAANALALEATHAFDNAPSSSQVEGSLSGFDSIPPNSATENGTIATAANATEAPQTGTVLDRSIQENRYSPKSAIQPSEPIHPVSAVPTPASAAVATTAQVAASVQPSSQTASQSNETIHTPLSLGETSVNSARSSQLHHESIEATAASTGSKSSDVHPNEMTHAAGNMPKDNTTTATATNLEQHASNHMSQAPSLHAKGVEGSYTNTDSSEVKQYGDNRRAPQWMANGALLTPQSAVTQVNEGEEPKTLTQSEADAMVERAVQAALNAYRKQEKHDQQQQQQQRSNDGDSLALAANDAQGVLGTEEDQPPARPSSPPPSTLLSKAAARSVSVSSRIAPENHEEYGTAYVNPHTTTYTSRRRESGSISSVSTSNTTTDRRPSVTSSQLEAAARTANGISDPNAIALITQTMIGDWMWKYTRKAVGNGLSERRHKRFFWIHPYTRTLYWSASAPGVDGRESKAKSAFIEDVSAIPDYTPNPTGLPQVSLMIQTPGRQLKITAPDASKHGVWYESLSYLLARANVDGTPKKSIDRRDITESVSTSAVSILKKPSFQRLRPVRSISSIAGSGRSVSSRSRVEQDDDDDDDEGLEDVRMCCNGKHHVSKLEKDHPHHHHQQQHHPHYFRSTTKRSQLSS